MSIEKMKVDGITRTLSTFFYLSSALGAISLVMGMAWLLFSPLDQFLIGGYSLRWMIFEIISMPAPFVPTPISEGITLIFPLVGISLYWATGLWLSRSLMRGAVAGIILLLLDIVFSLPALQYHFCNINHVCVDRMIDVSFHGEEVDYLISKAGMSEVEAARIVLQQFIGRILIVVTMGPNLFVIATILKAWKNPL